MLRPFRRRRASPAPEGQGTLWGHEHPDVAVAVKALRERAAGLVGPECTHTCVSADPPLPG